MDFLCILEYMCTLAHGLLFDIAHYYRMFLGTGPGIYFVGILYRMSNLCLLCILVDILRKDFRNSQVNIRKIQHCFSLYKWHYFHMVMVYMAFQEVCRLVESCIVQTGLPSTLTDTRNWVCGL